MTATADIPFGEPVTFQAGDTLEWRKSFPAYSAADGWVLTYALRGAGNIDLTATASGADHLIQVAASVTAAYAAGEYRWRSYVTKASERHALEAGLLEVTPNLAAVTTAVYDFRSQTKKTLDAIEAVITGRASKDQESYSIAGRSLQRTPMKDLLLLRDQYRAGYKAELQAEKIAAGGATDHNIYVRFTR